MAQRNALGELGGDAPDLAAAVSVAVKRDFEEMVAVWMRDVRGRFLAHLKVLYWESLEQGRAAKDIVETLVECTDIALDNLDKPLGDWRALQDLLLGKAAEGSKLWKRWYRALPARLRGAVKWVRQWVLHTGAVGAGGSRRRALVAVALFHDAHREACHAIFGHRDADEPAPRLFTGAAASPRARRRRRWRVSRSNTTGRVTPRCPTPREPRRSACAPNQRWIPRRRRSIFARRGPTNRNSRRL